jgi:uncharacterized RDD family membrane protein YckC
MTNLPPPSPTPPPPSTPAVAAAATTSGLPAGVTTVSPWGRLGAYLLEVILAIITLGIGWLIWAAMIGGTGQTPAKRLLNQRVIGADSLRPVGLGKMFWVRGLLAGIVASFAITFTIGILLFMPFWDRRNQNLWDKVSNTYVVSDPNDAWQTKPVGI